MRAQDAVIVGVGPVTFENVVAVARGHAPVAIAAEAVDAMAASRARIEALAADPSPVYGVSTGFGALATRHIPPERRTQLQRSLIRSHAAGSGAEVETEVVRAMMLLRLSTLATGHTGKGMTLAGTPAAAPTRAARPSSSTSAWPRSCECSSSTGAPPPAQGDLDTRNLVHAADIWFSVKKHWCLEAQRLVRAHRAVLQARH